MQTDSKTNPPLVDVAQIGARRHYAIPCGLSQNNMLQTLYTDAYLNTAVRGLISTFIPEPLRPQRLQRLLSRHAPGIPSNRIRTFSSLGYRRTAIDRSAMTSKDRIAHYIKYNSEFGKKVSQELRHPDAVYTFNGAALEILKEAKKRSIKCIVDQTSAACEIEQKLLEEEQKRWPDWITARTNSEDWLPMSERERKEWDLADLIICGSEYVADSIKQSGGPVEKCVVVPYGTRQDQFSSSLKNPDEKLNILFLGTLQLRKGIPYFLETAKALPGMNFKAIGPVEISSSVLNDLKKHISIEEPVTRSALSRLYDWAHVIVLPSISEGSSNVCYEAMASGVPVITTPNAGSVVRNGLDGYIVPIRSAEAITEKIELLATDRVMLNEMSRNAIERSKEYSLESYGKRLSENILKLFNK